MAGSVRRPARQQGEGRADHAGRGHRLGLHRARGDDCPIGKTYVLAQIEGVGSNIVYAAYTGGTANARSQADEITLNDLEAVRHLPHVVEVAGTY